MTKDNRPQHFHAISVKYIGPTDTKGDRVKLASYRFKSSLTLSRDQETNVLAQACDKLRSLGFVLVGTAETKEGWIVITSTFHGFKGPADRIEQY